MRYFGINLGHDTGVAVFNHFGELDFYGECERFSPRNKHYLHDLSPIISNFPELRIKQDDVVVVCATGNDETIECPLYDPKYIKFGRKKIDILRKKMVPYFIIDHHLAHAFSSWCFRPDNKERLFLSYDSGGPGVNDEMKSSLVGGISESGFWVIEEATPIFSSSVLSDILGPTSAGKVIGLAGYSNFPDIRWTDKNVAKLIASFYEKKLHKIHEKKTSYCRNPNFEEEELNQELICLIGGFYKFVTKQICENIFENIKNFSHGRGVIVAGGSALTLEINTQIYNLTKDVVFGPPIDDSGLALGAAAFAYWHINKRWPKASTPSLNELQSPLPSVGPQNPESIAKKLSNGSIIGLLRGKAEAGPRSLGFRSILASATKYENLKLVSEDLKGKEFYRPVASMVTEESFDRYFIGPRGKYMQYKVECTKEAQECLPAIVHKDNSAKPQVVSQKDDPWLHCLLKSYGELTGHECLINTSLNGKGKPICNTFEDAVEDFKEKNIELISISQDSWKNCEKYCITSM
jgi:carbamoyltransferase